MNPNAERGAVLGTVIRQMVTLRTPHPVIFLSSFVLDEFIRPVARQTGPSFSCGDCADCRHSVSLRCHAEDAKNVSGALTDQGVDASEKGFEALSETTRLSESVRCGIQNILGKRRGSREGAAVHSAYENMKDAGLFRRRGSLKNESNDRRAKRPTRG